MIGLVHHLRLWIETVILSSPRHRQNDGVLIRLRPEDRLNPKLNMRCVNHTDIVREQLAIDFVPRSDFRPTADAVAKFSLYHAERALYVATAMIAALDRM